MSSISGFITINQNRHLSIESIWSQYRSNLKSFLHSRVSDPDEVDDLLQTILIKVYKKQHTISSESSIKPWLFQVANNAIIDYYRKKSRSPEPRADNLWYVEDYTDIVSELSQCVEPFIAALPQESAALLKAIDLQGQSQKEYAQNHGVSYSTIKSRVQKGRGLLRDLFNDCCHLSLDQHGNIIDFDPKTGNCKNC